jgi:hypothetical protein
MDFATIFFLIKSVIKLQFEKLIKIQVDVNLLEHRGFL